MKVTLSNTTLLLKLKIFDAEEMYFTFMTSSFKGHQRFRNVNDSIRNMHWGLQKRLKMSACIASYVPCMALKC